MIRRNYISIVCLVAMWWVAQAQPRSLLWLARRPVAATESQTSQPYLLEEGFEESGYENVGWTEAGTGTVDEDYTTSPLAGAQSLRIVGSDSAASTYFPLSTSQAVLEVKFIFNASTLPASTTRTLIVLRSGVNAKAQVYVRNTGSVILLHGTVGKTAVGSISAGTTYTVWLRYVQGTGADGIATLGFSTDGIRPTSGDNFISITDGDSVSTISRVYFGMSVSDTFAYLIDGVKASTDIIP